MSEISLQTVVADLDRLPALSAVVQDLLDYLQRPEVDVGQVAHRIARDPTLAARLLRVANSSFYGLQGQVATIPDALVVLGLRAVRTLVTGAAVVGHFRTLATGRDLRAFWAHSAGTALCARILAREQAVSAENAYIAGLLHDIGRLILAARFPEADQRVESHRALRDCSSLEAEREVLGFDHAQIGAALAARWKFPAEIATAIASHHSPADQPDGALVDLIHVADVMAHALDFPGGEDDLVPRLSAVAWNRLGLGWDEFKRLLGEVDAQRGDAESVLE
ncbi:ribonuclease Y [mine drainage metagenome]|uniref:Ribonuclease Y n=1 Tax=mine drainage metagenome TaxID=410659 RepID=A0A1J5RYZ2_9ZZZZ